MRSEEDFALEAVFFSIVAEAIGLDLLTSRRARLFIFSRGFNQCICGPALCIGGEVQTNIIDLASGGQACLAVLHGLLSEFGDITAVRISVCWCILRLARDSEQRQQNGGIPHFLLHDE
ncbi:hypothetical protein [Halioglobus japonicus]|uniref:hypothetical protein n=1 Tax=Halioglobus japonicus TaxID=930805 RepID=UPI000C7F309A|nr:hypothetical protein [Halioglobus japonicus]